MDNKTDLINYVADNAEITKKDAARITDVLLNGICEIVNSDDKLQLVGFGSFELRKRAARKGQNPKLLKELKDKGVPDTEAKKHAEVDIPESKTVAFKAGKSLKECVNK